MVHLHWALTLVERAQLTKQAQLAKQAQLVCHARLFANAASYGPRHRFTRSWDCELRSCSRAMEQYPTRRLADAPR